MHLVEARKRISIHKYCSLHIASGFEMNILALLLCSKHMYRYCNCIPDVFKLGHMCSLLKWSCLAKTEQFSLFISCHERSNRIRTKFQNNLGKTFSAPILCNQNEFHRSAFSAKSNWKLLSIERNGE